MGELLRDGLDSHFGHLSPAPDTNRQGCQARRSLRSLSTRTTFDSIYSSQDMANERKPLDAPQLQKVAAWPSEFQKLRCPACRSQCCRCQASPVLWDTQNSARTLTLCLPRNSLKTALGFKLPPILQPKHKWRSSRTDSASIA